MFAVPHEYSSLDPIFQLYITWLCEFNGKGVIFGRKTIPFYVDSGKEIFEVCFALYKEWEWDNGEKDAMVRQISVWVGNLSDTAVVPHTLFDIDHKKANLTKTIDTINDKFGDHTIRNGFLLYSDKLTTVPNGFLADRWDRLQLAKTYDEG